MDRLLKIPMRELSGTEEREPLRDDQLPGLFCIIATGFVAGRFNRHANRHEHNNRTRIASTGRGTRCIAGNNLEAQFNQPSIKLKLRERKQLAAMLLRKYESKRWPNQDNQRFG